MQRYGFIFNRQRISSKKYGEVCFSCLVAPVFLVFWSGWEIVQGVWEALSAFGDEGGRIADDGCGRQGGIVRGWWILAWVVIALVCLVAILGKGHEIHGGYFGDAVAPEIFLHPIRRDNDGAVEEFGMVFQVEKIAVVAVGRQAYGHVLVGVAIVQAIADDQVRIWRFKVKAFGELAERRPLYCADNDAADGGWRVQGESQGFGHTDIFRRIYVGGVNARRRGSLAFREI